MGNSSLFTMFIFLDDFRQKIFIVQLHSLPVFSTLWRVRDAVAELLSNFLGGEHTRLRSAGLNTKKHSWKEKASAPKRLQSTNMAFEKNISAIFFSTGLHFSILEAVLHIHNWPSWDPIKKVIEVLPPSSRIQIV